MTHIPRKRFGQNFLRDATVVDRIVRAVAPQVVDHLVEIGPGEGALTGALLASAGRLDAVEIDRDLAVGLERRFGAQQGFRLHRADALRFDFGALAAESGRRLRVVGNLPYNISTPLLFHLFAQAEHLVDLHFMLQREVVDRLTAEPGTADYGRLGVMAGFHCQAEKLFEVYPESFHPAPKVVSAVVRLVPHAQPPVTAEPAALSRVVAAAFSQRRKTLRNSLGTLFDADDLRALDIDPGRRAETLSLEEFARLARKLAAGGGGAA